MQNAIVDMWRVVMDHDHNPLKNIPDLQTRHVALQLLAWMWCIIFSMSVGSITLFGVSAIVHSLLIAGVVLTVATFQIARHRPNSFVQFARGTDGEHE